MGRLRDVQHARYEAEREQARKDGDSLDVGLMTAASSFGYMTRSTSARWTDGAHVIALLFAQPDSHTIRTLDARGDYFDQRTADTWDLFFPGYHKSGRLDLERSAGSRQIGAGYTSSWFFNARDFDIFRREIEAASGRRWVYSGGTDLVVINGYMPDKGPITVDWASTFAGSLTEPDETGPCRSSRSLSASRLILKPKQKIRPTG
jgi:hypothetical protein